MNTENAGGIADTVAAHLEPVTRFDRSHITQQAPAVAIGVDLTLTLVQAVTYAISEGHGQGRLPVHVADCGNAQRYLARIQARLQQANTEGAQCLREFVAAAPLDYRRILAPASAFASPPGICGFEITCRHCEGRCQLRCTACSGSGMSTCGPCSGLGETTCTRCAGEGSCLCGNCSGTGTSAQLVHGSHHDHAAGKDVYTSGYVQKTCGACSGGGRIRCYDCERGRCRCGSCGGDGTVTCRPCAGCGRVDCGQCAATGIENQSGTVVASVHVHETLAFGPVDDALQDIIRTRIDTADLSSYGQLKQVAHQVATTALTSVHQLHIEAEHACLHAASRHFDIYGLGPQRQVLDLANIAGHLLEDDLAELEQAARASSKHLLRALQRCLASELNLLIAEHVIGTPLPAQEAAAGIERQFHSLVEASYVARTATALHAGFGKLYRTGLLRAALWLVAAATLFSLLLFTFGTPRNGIWHITAWTTLGALPWFALELAVQRRIRRRFPVRLSARLKALISKSSSLTAWRLGVTASIAACAFGSATLAAKVPLMNEQHLNQTIHLRSWDKDKHVDVKLTFISHSLAVYNDRSSDTTEGRHEIQEAARAFVSEDNRIRAVDYVAMIAPEQVSYPACAEALSVVRPPNGSAHRIGGVLVHCGKSVSEQQRTWNAFVPVLLDTTRAHPMML